ncbi:MAG: DegT/DnrJ/EryC1/StrS family aminotransferase [Candidatus Eisenbacteria bacterium]|nr:DegT/DnrJ/EryC1/StrS family aminotransferase [Candidatus Latescibacterota bacterium]MBD3301661.1 DegT/DnrJ/EryC1/StrS family aminotransferase [Candidatus Eisenbacteria bacterium]
MKKPAILGGPIPETVVPISQPTLPDFERYATELREVFASRQITNGKWVERLERTAAERLGVPEVVALSSATSGLILVAKLLGIRGTVLLPAFTFPATLHILLWNGLAPRLVDCDPETFNLDPDDVARRLDETVSALVPVYIFGNAPDWGRLEPLLESRNLRSFSDAAHALGSRLGDRHAGGFGDAEVFSLAPTKVTVSGEGGLVATRNRDLAAALRVARNYGNPGDYDCVTIGLNARQSELHALLGFLSIERTEEHVAARERIVERYREGLHEIPGIGFQKIAPDCRSTHNYFAILVEPEPFGLTNRQLKRALEADRIQSRIYFHPPLHRQSHLPEMEGLQADLPNTDRVCARVLCLPLTSHQRDEETDRVIETIRAIQESAPAVERALDGDA